MKKTLIMIAAVLLLFVGWFFVFDAYLCSHLYYGFWPFLSCAGGQGKGINMIWTSANWRVLVRALVSSLAPALYMFFTDKIRLKGLVLWFSLGALLYMGWFLLLKDALLGQWTLILAFNVAVILFVVYWFMIAMTVLGSRVFALLRWRIAEWMHDTFLKFTLGLIVFCLINVILLLINAYYGVVIYAQVAGLSWLMWKYAAERKHILHSVESFVQSIHSALSQHTTTKILYYGIIIVACMYVFMGLNLAYIPYPTAWDANHAYILFPRAWAIHNGYYWWASGAAALPNLWYGFLAFWFKIAQSFPLGKWLFGISPDSLTVIMNFWSWPWVLLGTWFLLHALLDYIKTYYNHQSSEKFILPTICFGILLMLLWLSSGMWAFLVFVDNKTDLAVMFFGVLALYVGIQFIAALKHGDHTPLKQHAILAGLFFAASALAKPTGMFDILHFAMLFLLQWHSAFLVIGWYVMSLGLLWVAKLSLISQFLTTSQSYILLWVWGAMSLISLIPIVAKKTYRHYLRYFLIWIATICIAFVVYKWPFSMIQQWINKWSISVPEVVRTILLGKAQSEQASHILLASTVSPDALAVAATTDAALINTGVVAPETVLPTREQCIASRPADNAVLYKDIRDIAWDAGANEDLGRYIWYWQKKFNSLWITALLPHGCYSIYADARAMCDTIEAMETTTVEGMIELLEKNNISDNTAKRITDLQNLSWDVIAQQKIVKSVIAYVRSNTILKNNVGLYIPYKLLVPFNVTFNWSLQNLSSYYTDIGIMWLLCLWLIIIWLIYWLYKKQKALVHTGIITLWAWAIWWVVGSSIIWYSLGLILRTILGFVVYVYYLLHENKNKDSLQHILVVAIISLIALRWFLQLLLNFLRISSQWAGGPFWWYKANVGMTYLFNDQLVPVETAKIWYGAQDVLEVQFPHYLPLLSKVNTRANDDGMIIAGTYFQYFVDNQRNIDVDGFLANFSKTISDNNVCNSYLRLKDAKRKYIIVDPNIASVVVGDANKTLLDRFLAALSLDNKSITQYGALTMMQALVQWGYAKLEYTNNIISKYAFVMPDDKLSAMLNVPVGEQLTIERAKMSAARFFPEANTYGNVTLQYFAERVNTLEYVQDLADILWREVRLDKVLALLKIIVAGPKQEQYQTIQKDITALTNDERIVLQQSLWIKQAQSKDAQQFRQSIISIISQSMNNGSQLIALTIE